MHSIPATSDPETQTLEPQINGCGECIANVIDSHQLLLEVIEDELSDMRAARAVILQRMASEPNNPAHSQAFQNVQSIIQDLQREEHDQSLRLSGASDCSGCG